MTEINVTTEAEWDVLDTFNLPMLVLVTAPAWCVPCQRFEPHWAKAQESESMDEFTFVKIDAGASPEDTGNHWASKRFNVLGVPTVFLIDKDGERRDITARAVVPFMREVLNG